MDDNIVSKLMGAILKAVDKSSGLTIGKELCKLSPEEIAENELAKVRIIGISKREAELEAEKEMLHLEAQLWWAKIKKKYKLHDFENLTFKDGAVFEKVSQKKGE